MCEHTWCEHTDVCIRDYRIFLFVSLSNVFTSIIIILQSLSVRTRHEIWSMPELRVRAKPAEKKKNGKDKNIIAYGAWTMAKCCMSVVTAGKSVVLPVKTKAAVPNKIRKSLKKTVSSTKPTEVHHRVINIRNKKIKKFWNR